MSFFKLVHRDNSHEPGQKVLRAYTQFTCRSEPGSVYKCCIVIVAGANEAASCSNGGRGAGL